MAESGAGEYDEPAVQALADELLPIFYADMRRLARRERRRVGGGGATLQTTALVHEAYLKLRRSGGWTDDRHFLCAAAQAMRHALINHAQARLAEKRDPGMAHVSLAQVVASDASNEVEILAVSAALERLSAQSPRLARIVECRYYAGYSEPQTARALGVSERTVRRDWVLAKAWLYRELTCG